MAMFQACQKYEPGLGACPCACDQVPQAEEGGLDWFKLAVIVGLVALIAKRTSRF